jgi:excisionase family DNA binding protein
MPLDNTAQVCDNRGDLDTLAGYCTTEEAGVLLGIRRSFVCALIRAGRIRAERFGLMHLVNRASVALYAATKSKRGRPGSRRRAEGE